MGISELNFTALALGGVLNLPVGGLSVMLAARNVDARHLAPKFLVALPISIALWLRWLTTYWARGSICSLPAFRTTCDLELYPRLFLLETMAEHVHSFDSLSEGLFNWDTLVWLTESEFEQGTMFGLTVGVFVPAIYWVKRTRLTLHRLQAARFLVREYVNFFCVASLCVMGGLTMATKRQIFAIIGTYVFFVNCITLGYVLLRHRDSDIPVELWEQQDGGEKESDVDDVEDLVEFLEDMA